MTLIFVIMVITISNCNALVNPIECQKTPNDKCPGLSSHLRAIPDINVSPYNVTNQTMYKACFDTCFRDELCHMAVFNRTFRKCQKYYNVTTFHQTILDIYMYRWKCCNLSQSYDVGNRCPGYWEYMIGNKSKNMYRMKPVLILMNTNKNLCQALCLSNPICGAVNVLIHRFVIPGKYNCELILKFPVEEVYMFVYEQWLTYSWKCVANYSLPSPPKECRERRGFSAGFWRIESRRAKIPPNFRQLISFYAYDYKDCLRDCFETENCARVWFSSSKYLCILEAKNVSKCYRKADETNYIYIVFEWTLCSSVGINPGGSLSVFDVKDENCIRILNNTLIKIVADHCELPVNIHSSVDCHSSLCSHPKSQLKWHLCYFCQNNQSFQFLNTDVIENINATRFFSGYATFWLLNVTSTNTEPVPNSLCKVFNADFSQYHLNDLKIMTRSDWFALDNLEEYNPFPPTPELPFVVILITNLFKCNCYSNTSCSFIMREFQMIYRSHEVIFNFVVTGDGTVYEGTGWSRESDAVNINYNSKSISIAFCGQYLDHPNIQSLSAVKKLIKLGVKRRTIAKNYTLLLLRDVTNQDLLDIGLNTVIKLWPHYRNHTEIPCQKPPYYIAVMNILFFLIICVISMVLTHDLILPMKHQRYCKIKLPDLDTSISSSDDIRIFRVHGLSSGINFVSPFTTTFWIEDKLKRILGKKRHQCNCKKAIFTIFNYYRFRNKLIDLFSLTKLTEISDCTKVIAFIFDGNNDVGVKKMYIFHCDLGRSISRIKYCIMRDKCLCLNYNISLYTPNCRGFLDGINSSEIDNSKKKALPLILYNMSVKYCFVYDKNGCLRFY